jgi:hypothetical protein
MFFLFCVKNTLLENLGISMKYTEQDLNVPLCIWPTTVHPSKTYYNITRNSLFNNNIQLSDIHEDTSPSQMSLLPVLQKGLSFFLFFFCNLILIYCDICGRKL